MKEFLLILITLTFLGCSPKIITNSFDIVANNRLHLFYEPFAFIELDTFDKNAFKPVGQVEIKDGGLTLNCDYETIKKLAKEEALKLGGNCLVITEHRKPNQWSTCHRIRADVYLINNAKDYENQVIWNQNRKLEISDFKGSIEKRPFTAATLSSFRYRIGGETCFSK